MLISKTHRRFIFSEFGPLLALKQFFSGLFFFRLFNFCSLVCLIRHCCSGAIISAAANTDLESNNTTKNHITTVFSPFHLADAPSVSLSLSTSCYNNKRRHLIISSWIIRVSKVCFLIILLTFFCKCHLPKIWIPFSVGVCEIASSLF